MIDPKITLHGDLVTAGSLIHASRVCLDEQLRQDGAFRRNVSKQRWGLGHGAHAVITHEYGQTYIQIVTPLIPGKSQIRSPTHPYYFAVGATAAGVQGTWLSPNGVVWPAGPPPPNWETPYYTALLPNERILVSGIVSGSVFSFWVVDAKTGICSLPVPIHALGGNPILSPPRVLYLGQETIWCALETQAGIWAATFNVSTAELVVGGQLFAQEYSAMAFIPFYIQGGRRAGQPLADVFIIAYAYNGTAYNGELFWMPSITTTAQTLPLPTIPANSTLNAVSGPNSSMILTADLPNSGGSQVYVNQNVFTGTWGTALALLGAPDTEGYHPNTGWAYCEAPPSGGGASLFTSPTGAKWNTVPVSFWAGEVSFIFGPNGILIPEGTALLTAQGLQVLGPPAPFTAQFAAYQSFYAGPSPQPWLNLYP